MKDAGKQLNEKIHNQIKDEGIEKKDSSSEEIEKDESTDEKEDTEKDKFKNAGLGKGGKEPTLFPQPSASAIPRGDNWDENDDCNDQRNLETDKFKQKRSKGSKKDKDKVDDSFTNSIGQLGLA